MRRIASRTLATENHAVISRWAKMRASAIISAGHVARLAGELPDDLLVIARRVFEILKLRRASPFKLNEIAHQMLPERHMAQTVDEIGVERL